MALTKVTNSMIEGALLSALDYGVVNDGVTDNTVALQAWIDAIDGSGARGFGQGGFLPAGVYKTGPLTISRPVSIFGAGKQSSVLELIVGSTGPLINIATAYDSVNYALNSGDPAVSLADLTLTGTKTDPNGITNGCDGIRLTNAVTNAIRPAVFLRNVHISNLPRDGINAASWLGIVAANDLYVYNVGRDCLSANSCNDWQFTRCQFAVATSYGATISGCGNFQFNSCYFYSAQKANLLMYAAAGSTASQNTFYQCSFDRAKENGIEYEWLNGKNNILNGCFFALNSNTNSNTYSDIKIGVNVTSGLVINACYFDLVYSQDPAYFPINNIRFFGSVASVIVTGGTQFAAGSARTTGATNSVNQLFINDYSQTSDFGIINYKGGVKVFANTPNTGIDLRAMDSTLVALIKGQDANNKSGMIQLFEVDGTTVGFQASAYPADNIFAMTPFNFATLPSAAAWNGRTVRIADRNSRLASSDGTDWRFAGDGTIVV